jgi:hypothetical protein
LGGCFVFNAMVNMAFKHLDIDRLSPFRRLYILGIPHLWVRKNSLTDRKTQAFIYRLKALGDVPVPIAEAITGHGRNASEFARYGSVGYTLEQKKAVIERVLV